MVWHLPKVSTLLSWPLPNTIDPVRRGPEYDIITAIFLALGTIAVFTRLYIRLFIRRWFGLDDVFIILGWLTALGVSAVVLYSVHNLHWDMHTWDVAWPEILESAKTLYIALIIWSASSCFSRLSLLCFYYRLIDHVKLPQYKWILHLTFVANISFTLLYIGILAGSCGSASTFWSSELHPKCIDVPHFLFIMSILNTSMELIVVLLPAPAIMLLRLDRNQKWSVTCLLCLGVLTIAAGAVRCVFVYKAVIQAEDMMWWSQPHWISSEVEINVALLVACAPALRPIMGRLFSQKPVPRKLGDSKFTDMDTESARGSIYNEIKKTHNSKSTVYFDVEGIRPDSWAYTVGVDPKVVERALNNKSGRVPGISRLSSYFGFRSSLHTAQSSSNATRIPDSYDYPTHLASNRSSLSGWEIGIANKQYFDRASDLPDLKTTEEIHVWREPSMVQSNREALQNPFAVNDFAISSGEDRTSHGDGTSVHDWDKFYTSMSPISSPTSTANIGRQTSTRNASAQLPWMASPVPPRRKPFNPMNSSRLWTDS